MDGGVGKVGMGTGVFTDSSSCIYVDIDMQLDYMQTVMVLFRVADRQVEGSERIFVSSQPYCVMLHN